MLQRYTQIPDVITVHLGGKDADAPNITLPFVEYLKGCAACLVCPTWPEHAQRANIYAATSFALHRVSRKWYRARGCAFDITGSAQDDLPFAHEACLFCNTNCLVEEMFNNYLTRHGSSEPLLAQICPDSRQAAGSAGLCQQGAVAMAQKGYTVYDILRKYYGEDIVIIENAPRQGEKERFMGTPLMCGALGDDICAIKRQLNRIGQNYPAIALLDAGNPNFDPPCERAVRTFQYIFDLPVTGVLDKATWYGIKRTCAGIEQSEAASFEQKAVAALKPVSFNAPANPPQAEVSPTGAALNSSLRQEIAAGRMPSLIVPGHIIPGNTLPSVIIPGAGTLDSVISDDGIAERAERAEQGDAWQSVPPESSAAENAARWERTRQSIMQSAAQAAPLSGIITDRGIAARAEAAEQIPGHPVPDAAVEQSPISDSAVQVQEGAAPEGSAAENAARWERTRQSIMQSAAQAAPLSGIITDRGIAARAEAAEQIPGHPVPDAAMEQSPISDSAVQAQEGAAPEGSAVGNAARWERTRQSIVQSAADGAIFQSVNRSETPQGRAAQSTAERMDIPLGLGLTESPVIQPRSPADHLVKIGPSVSTALPDEGTGVDSGHAVEWLKKFYDL